jgi:hypothetical protein
MGIAFKSGITIALFGVVVMVIALAYSVFYSYSEPFPNAAYPYGFFIAVAGVLLMMSDLLLAMWREK